MFANVCYGPGRGQASGTARETLTVLALFLATQLAAAPAVSPQDRAEAARLVHESMSEYDLGHFQPALAAAERAYRLDPLPQLLFNLGQCHRALHQWDQAAFFFRRYLEKLPKAPNRQLAEALLAEADAKAEADAHGTAGPAPVEVPIVVAPAVPSPAPTTAPQRAPEAAIGLVAPPPPRHTHWLGIGLLVGAAAAAAVAVVAQVEVQTALEDRSLIRGKTLGSDYNRLATEEAMGPTWLGVSIGAGVLAAAGVAAGIATW